MNYQRLILAGNVTNKARRQTSKKGDVAFTTFGVVVSNTKDQKAFFPVTVFGRHAEAVAKYITKGRYVLVEGRVEVGEFGRFNVVADRVRLGPKAKAGSAKKAKK